MNELNIKQVSKIQRAVNIMHKGESAIIDEIDYLDKKISNSENNIDLIDNKIVYVARELDTKINDVYRELDSRLVESLKTFSLNNDIFSKIKLLKGEDGINGIDGTDGKAPTKQELLKLIKPLIPTEAYLSELIKPLIPTIETPVVTIVNDTPEEIVNKINSLNTDDDNTKIGQEHIKDLLSELENLKSKITELSKRKGSNNSGALTGIRELVAGSNISIDNSNPQYPIVSSTGGGGGGGYTKATPTGTVNGVNTIFTVVATPVYIIADSSTYFENAGYTIAGLTITMETPPSKVEGFRYFY